MGFQHNKELASASGKKSKRGEGKITKEVKQMITDLTNALFNEVFSNLSEIEYYQKANILLKLFEYQTPRLKTTEHKTDIDSLTDSQVDAIANKILDNEKRITE